MSNSSILSGFVLFKTRRRHGGRVVARVSAPIRRVDQGLLQEGNDRAPDEKLRVLQRDRVYYSKVRNIRSRILACKSGDSPVELSLGAGSEADSWFWGWRASPSPSLISGPVGWRSLVVKHMVHLKTLSSLGHRTIEPQVMQSPVAKSLPARLPLFLCIFGPAQCPCTGVGALSAAESGPPYPNGVFVRFRLPTLECWQGEKAWRRA